MDETAENVSARPVPRSALQVCLRAFEAALGASGPEVLGHADAREALAGLRGEREAQGPDSCMITVPEWLPEACGSLLFKLAPSPERGLTMLWYDWPKDREARGLATRCCRALRAALDLEPRETYGPSPLVETLAGGTLSQRLEAIANADVWADDCESANACRHVLFTMAERLRGCTEADTLIGEDRGDG